MTDAELKSIEERANAATEGPWEHDERGNVVVLTDASWITGEELKVASSLPYVNSRDAEFIALARTDIPALIAEVRRLKEELVETKAALAEQNRNMVLATANYDRINLLRNIAEKERDQLDARVKQGASRQTHLEEQVSRLRAVVKDLAGALKALRCKPAGMTFMNHETDCIKCVTLSRHEKIIEECWG